MSTVAAPPIIDDKLWLPPEYPEVLADMAQSIAASVRKNLPELPMERVVDVALGATEFVRIKHGGGAIYLGKGESYENSLRDKEIWALFKGNNYLQLAKQFDLTEMRVRQIVGFMKLRDRAERQNRLF